MGSANRWRWIWCLLVGVIALLAGCAAEKAPVAQVPEAEDNGIEAAIQRLSTEEKAGQLMMAGFYGTEMNDDIAFLLREYHLGGVILFDRNIASEAQTRALTRAVQEAAGSMPLFVAIDEEGGIVVRGEGVIEPPPAAADLGAAGDRNAARAWAARTGAALRALGVNVNFAPVADLALSPDRAFSDDPATVAAFAAATADGYREAGILGTLKHFPGLGKGEENTHWNRVVIPAPLETLRAEDMRPFREVLAGRSADALFVMVGHADYPAIDEERPASLSPEVIGLLREEIGFDGVVVTDDLGMGAITQEYRPDEAAVLAIRAGADLVLLCHEYEDVRTAHRALCRAIEDGTLPGARVTAALTHILRAKRSMTERAMGKTAA